MPIDFKSEGLNTKLDSSSKRVSSSDLNWGDIEDGKYNAKLVIVYPWKSVTHDTSVRAKDADGKYIKDADGKYVKESVGELTWHITDAVFEIVDGIYEGYAVKGTLSTHPDMIGSAKRFLYNAGLFDVTLTDLFKHTGALVSVIVKHKDDNVKDKMTGATTVVSTPYVSYYEKYEAKE
jgi:hypothetical protein